MLTDAVVETIPGMDALQRAAFGQTEAEVKETDHETKDNGGPPARPVNDTQIEEFLKEQYKSKSGKDMPKIGEDKD